jgi:hypothetical protein
MWGMETNDVDKMAYEVLVRTWRPLTIDELIGGMRELCAANPSREELTAALSAGGQFTRDAFGRYALDEFNSSTPGDFSYLDAHRLLP